MFKVNEKHGIWLISRDSENVKFEGEPISYEDYVELKDKPERAKDRFERKDGKLTRKPKGIDNPAGKPQD